jgi:uncharacterized membrane protein YfcA
VSIHAADQRIQQKARESGARGCVSLHALQFLSDSPDLARYSSDGSGRRRSCLEFGRNYCITERVIFLILVCAAIFLIAVLYSSVGHAGASGYIAVLTLFSFGPAMIKPTVLLLNILVATIATFQFWRAGHFSWQTFWPFAALSVPFAFLGGYMLIPAHTFKLVVGVVLLVSALRLFWANKRADAGALKPAPLSVALPVGAGIGFLSGITSTGGGIFLTPLLLFFRWTSTKRAAAISALFVLVNSISGLLGYFSNRQPLPSLAWPLAAVAVLGGVIGSQMGSRHLPNRAIYICLASVLTIAGLKLVLS